MVPMLLVEAPAIVELIYAKCLAVLPNANSLSLAAKFSRCWGGSSAERLPTSRFPVATNKWEFSVLRPILKIEFSMNFFKIQFLQDWVS